MADMDPELQRRLNASILGFGVMCNRIRDAATSAALAAHDLAFEIDDKARAAAGETVSQLIDRAKR